MSGNVRIFLFKLDKNIFTFNSFNNIVDNFLFKYNKHSCDLEKKSQSSFWYFCNFFSEEIDISFLQVENLTVSPQGLSSILRFPCGEIIENSFRRNENLISSPQEGKMKRINQSEHCIYNQYKYFKSIF